MKLNKFICKIMVLTVLSWLMASFCFACTQKTYSFTQKALEVDGVQYVFCQRSEAIDVAKRIGKLDSGEWIYTLRNDEDQIFLFIKEKFGNSKYNLLVRADIGEPVINNDPIEYIKIESEYSDITKQIVVEDACLKDQGIIYKVIELYLSSNADDMPALPGKGTASLQIVYDGFPQIYQTITVIKDSNDRFYISTVEYRYAELSNEMVASLFGQMPIT
ncbi:MAG: hypothetical protein PHT58_00800 [Eubacteriales bacterium]|nr:hypothetical protein [Eubacteriales bacterium]